MTDPLIDRAALDEVLDGHLMYRGKERIAAADAVLTYLRSVLTPEALRTYDLHTGDHMQGDGMYRRILGEDK
jgi:hypothetical protein